MILLYRDKPIFVYCFNHQLGSVERDLSQLKAEKLLLSSADTLSAIGYCHNVGLARNESLLSLAMNPVSLALQEVREPAGFVFQHSLAESALLPYDPAETNLALRTRYFPAEMMRQLQVDHLPYFCSFASGCAGFSSVLGLAGGFLSCSSDDRPAICVMADCMPPGVPYDMLEERILASDHSSAFAVGREQRGYQLLGINYYSTTRTKVPFLEIVKRTVRMVKELAANLGLDLAGSNSAIHYPNIFPETWVTVTRYLRSPQIEHVVDGMFDRAHCGATDSVISLAKLHRSEEGRIHIVVNYGIGLHLGVCIFKETDANESAT